MAIKIQPLADRVIIKPFEREGVTKGGIVLPDFAKGVPREGEVVAIGPGKRSPDGKRIPLDIEVGDKVIFIEHAGAVLKVDDEEFLMVIEPNIYAKRI